MAPRVRDSYLDARRDEIVDAAMRVFVQKGLAASTIQDIAAEADVAAGSIYRYFASKDDLVHAVWDRCAADHAEIVEQALHEASPLSTLRAFGALNVALLQTPDARDRAVLSLQMALAGGSEANGPSCGLPPEAAQLLGDLVRRAQGAGELARDLDPDALAIVLEAFISGLQVRIAASDEQRDLAPAFELIVRMVESLRDARPSHAADR